MSDYLIKKETLTDIADEVRELSGTTSSMSTSAMITNLGEVNNEVESQTALIEQITTALEGKAGGDSGCGETYTVTITSIYNKSNAPSMLDVSCYYTNNRGEYIQRHISQDSITLTDVLSGFLIFHDAIGTGFTTNNISTSDTMERMPFIGGTISIFKVFGDGTITITMN